MADYIDASELIRYNANDMDNRIGDCVKRSLSLAYRMDYREVSKELSRLRSSGDPYNTIRTYKKFIEARGDKFVPVTEDITTEQFADNNPNGTYVLRVGKFKGKHSTHLVTIIDGKVYDSWDSRPWYVYQYAVVTGEVPDLHEDINVEDIRKSVYDAVLAYLSKLGPLKDGQEANYEVDMFERDSLTSIISIRLVYQVRSRTSVGRCSVAVKVNIGLDVDKNIEVNVKKCKQKIYDWMYEINRDLRAEQLELNPDFWGDKKLLLNLPKEIVPQIRSADKYYDTYEQKDRYTFRIDPFPDDSDTHRWYLEVFTLGDAKDAMNRYLQDRTRIEF